MPQIANITVVPAAVYFRLAVSSIALQIYARLHGYGQTGWNVWMDRVETQIVHMEHQELSAVLRGMSDWVVANQIISLERLSDGRALQRDFLKANAARNIQTAYWRSLQENSRSQCLTAESISGELKFTITRAERAQHDAWRFARMSLASVIEASELSIHARTMANLEKPPTELSDERAELLEVLRLLVSRSLTQPEVLKLLRTDRDADHMNLVMTYHAANAGAACELAARANAHSKMATAIEERRCNIFTAGVIFTQERVEAHRKQAVRLDELLALHGPKFH